MKTLVKWAIKKFANCEKIKDAIHNANAKLATLEGSDRVVAVTGYCNDAAETVAVYAEAFANDGKMDESELAAVNARCDAMLDKYLDDDRIDAIVDAIFN